jgi:hypothetical protein
MKVIRVGKNVTYTAKEKIISIKWTLICKVTTRKDTV